MTRPRLAALIATCALTASASAAPPSAPASPNFSWPDAPNAAIRIPTLHTTNPQSAPTTRRINAWLADLRRTAQKSRATCRITAGKQPFHYTLKATPVAAPGNILGITVQEYAMCGGAHGSEDTHSTSFDLATGQTIDLLTRYHLTKATALKAAVKAYHGEEACTDYLRNPPMDDAYGLDSVVLTPKGLAATITFNTPAAESCGETPAIIPFSALKP